MNELTLVPAYGRQYNTDEDMLRDWNEGKDFRIYPNGPYTSIRDIIGLKWTYKTIRITRDFFIYKTV